MLTPMLPSPSPLGHKFGPLTCRLSTMSSPAIYFSRNGRCSFKCTEVVTPGRRVVLAAEQVLESDRVRHTGICLASKNMEANGHIDDILKRPAGFRVGLRCIRIKLRILVQDKNTRLGRKDGIDWCKESAGRLAGARRTRSSQR